MNVGVMASRRWPRERSATSSTARSAAARSLQYALRVVHVGLAGVGGAHRAAAAVQQLGADDSLHLFDLLRQGRLGDVQLLGGTGEVAVLGHRDQIAEMTKFGTHIRL